MLSGNRRSVWLPIPRVVLFASRGGSSVWLAVMRRETRGPILSGRRLKEGRNEIRKSTKRSKNVFTRAVKRQTFEFVEFYLYLDEQFERARISKEFPLNRARFCHKAMQLPKARFVSVAPFAAVPRVRTRYGRNCVCHHHPSRARKLWYPASDLRPTIVGRGKNQRELDLDRWKIIVSMRRPFSLGNAHRQKVTISRLRRTCVHVHLRLHSGV